MLFYTIAILEAGDNINHLPMLGMTEETVTLLESIPEFIDTLNIGGRTYYRIIIILSADVGRVIYTPEALVTGTFNTWINTWKEEAHG